ncbi:MAG: hypothetical protein IJH65_16895 [Methanobrevibacter sp.]|nr:hypothetical protein [Methanobrevibacter sp.]
MRYCAIKVNGEVGGLFELDKLSMARADFREFLEIPTGKIPENQQEKYYKMQREIKSAKVLFYDVTPVMEEEDLFPEYSEEEKIKND